ncbi:MAG: hypothetical protein A2X18_03695 [Bacteroidetes bacterium GWF2_40_14]|nr:MAG: hypothetical protein A2X18_03695 [Bacteroidetes bacterium GWF2_40_14]
MYIPDLPGKKAHLKMAPLHRLSTLKIEEAPPENSRESAVLVLLFPASSENILDWEVLVIKRNIYDGVHSGQIAFPGGKCEDIDKDYADTACRESHEELSLDRDKIEIVGLLSRLYVPPSNFTIYPVLAYASCEMELIPDHREVVEYRKIPLKLFDPTLSEIFKIRIGREEYVNAPGYTIGDYFIWGATAMILSELYQVAAEARLTISRNNP